MTTVKNNDTVATSFQKLKKNGKKSKFIGFE